MNQALKRFLRLLACKFNHPSTAKAAKTYEELLDPLNDLTGRNFLLFHNPLFLG